MAIEIDIRIIGEATWQVVQDLKQFADHLSSGLGVGLQATDTPDATPLATKATATTATAAVQGNGAAEPDKPPTTRKRSTAAKPEPEEKAKLDRAAIIDGLTKIYSKGDEDVRQAITKFRDGQGSRSPAGS